MKSAFPQTTYIHLSEHSRSHGLVEGTEGLNVRELFAAFALIGVRQSLGYVQLPPDQAAELAVKDADALIVELSKKK